MNTPNPHRGVRQSFGYVIYISRENDVLSRMGSFYFNYPHQENVNGVTARAYARVMRS